MATLYQVPTQNALQYTLDSQIAAGASSLTLNQSVAGIVQAPGVCVIDRVDSAGNVTASKREYKTFTGVSSAQLTGLSGGLAGSTDQVHSVGAIVEFIPDVIWGQALYSVLTTEHNASGLHTGITGSTASLNAANIRDFVVASTASIQLAGIKLLNIGTYANFSGASTSGIWPSSASGSVLTSSGNGTLPVFAPSAAAGTGGLNALFQVPGGLASSANIGGLIPIPTAFTTQFVNAYVQTPSSVASVGVHILKNFAVVGVCEILGGATFASSASLSNTSLVAGDVLTMDIRSTASLASDLSVILRGT